MRRILYATLATLVLAGCQTSPESGESAGAGSPTGTTAGTSTGATTTASASSQDRVDSYVQVRRQLESQYPDMRTAFQGGDLASERSRLEPALQGSRLSTDEFIRLHQEIQSDPALRSRVEAALATPATTGAAPGGSTTGSATSGGAPASGQTQPGWRGAPTDAQPPTTTGGAGSTSGGAAAPAASPQ